MNINVLEGHLPELLNLLCAKITQHIEIILAHFRSMNLIEEHVSYTVIGNELMAILYFTNSDEEVIFEDLKLIIIIENNCVCLGIGNHKELLHQVAVPSFFKDGNFVFSTITENPELVESQILNTMYALTALMSQKCK